jgi:hypothetical protein
MAVILALRVALAGLPAEDRAAALADAGLAEGELAEDVRTIGATYAWMARKGGRLAWRATRAAGRATGRLLGGVASRVRRRS